jgi:hypothetical protein
MDTTLTAAWCKGLSAPQIAVLIGGVSAGAVRKRRMKLGLRPRTGEELAFIGRHKAPPSVIPPSAPMPPLNKLGPDSAPKPWAAREWRECAFAVGEDSEGLIACCGPVAQAARRPYCPFHQALTVKEAESAERAA